ncbi:MAG TPA: hypothetical protein VKY27_12675 [Bacteriovoracaceae bacterium]|nr:hypothetical protein [Bacteriovoracaceae bacterium]
MEISEEIEEKLGLLKSKFLSEIITHAPTGDFDFTDYHKFDHQIEETLTSPDEVWIYDEEVEVYRKFFVEKGESYSQIILTLKESKDNPLMVILNFITKFEVLAERFCRGERKKISTRH